MIRLLYIAIVAGLVWYAWRLFKRLLESGSRSPARKNSGGQFVRCEQCGLHVPQAEALQIEGHYYCGREHAALARTSNDRTAD